MTWRATRAPCDNALQDEMAEQVSRFEKWRAFAVHLLTASGALWALMAIIAAAEHHWVSMFGWLGLALFVDAIDGPIARKVDITRVLPNWSGEILDQIIDYATYVIIPAFALYQSGIIGGSLSVVAAGMIVISSAIYYADTRMKTTDYFFRGFPVAWNMVIFSFFAVRPGEWTAFAFVTFCAIATFLPVKFVHPTRVVPLRPWTLTVCAVWAAFGVAALWTGFDSSPVVRFALLLTGLYLFCIGAILQVGERMRRSPAN